MYAQVIPAARLPANLHRFDYRIPSACGTITRGQLVTVPLRNKSVFGVVYAVNPFSSASSLKSIQTVISKTPLFHPDYLEWICELAQSYGVSAGALLCMTMPERTKTKLRAAEILSPPVKPAAYHSDTPVQRRLYMYADQAARQARLLQMIRRHTLVLTPEISDANRLYASLPEPVRARTVCWTSLLTVKERYDAWWAVRNGEIDQIIGTRSAVFLPFQRLKSIVIDQEHSDHYKDWDQYPRYDARDLCPDLARMFQADLHIVDIVPSVNLYHAAHHSGPIIPSAMAKHARNRLNLIHHTGLSRNNILSATAITAIEHALQHKKQAFVLLNRKGFAICAACANCDRVLNCNDCAVPFIYRKEAHMLECIYCGKKQPIPETCKHCSGAEFTLWGTGTERIEEELRRVLSHSVDRKDIIRLEQPKRKNSAQNRKEHDAIRCARIIVGTRYALSKLLWNDIDSVLWINPDLSLSIPEYYAAEDVWHTMHGLLSRMAPSAGLFIQTSMPEHSVFRYVSTAERFYREELDFRKQHLYPPFCRLIRIIIREHDETNAREKAQTTRSLLVSALTAHTDQHKISHPTAMTPMRMRGYCRYVIIVKLVTNDWRPVIKPIIARLPPGVRVDPLPVSILS